MWKVPPDKMCRKHLLGEHVEMHMFVGTINKGSSIDGYIRANLVEPGYIRRRHEELARELLRRGYNHHSPLPEFLGADPIGPRLDEQAALNELISRCPECREGLRRGKPNECV